MEHAAQHDIHDESSLEKAEGPSLPTTCTQPSFSLLHEIAFITIICMGQILTQAGLNQVISPLHIIGESFHVSNPGQLSWYVASYGLTVGTFILAAGRVGEIFGHKKLLIIGYLWFGFWSLLCGISVYTKSQIFFDVCRALQGIGPAILLTNALAILGRTYPPGRKKEMVFALFGAMAPNGGLLGLVFGALLAQKASWPWVFYILTIVCVLCAVIGFLVIPADVEDSEDKRFDYAGFAVGIAGLVLFNVAWNQAPIVGWGTAYIIVILVLGFLLLVAFFLVEKRVAHPLVPTSKLSPQVGFVLGCVAFGWSSFGIFLYYLVQIMEVLRGLSPLTVGAQFAPISVSGFCAAITTGFLLSRVPAGYIMTVALTFFMIGNVLLATMPVDQIYWIQTFLALILTPWGMDMSFPAATIIVSNFLPREHQGVAASLVTTVVNYSISLGLGIAGTVEVHVNRGGADILRGYRGAWYAAIGLDVLGILFSLYFAFTEQRKKKMLQ